MRKNLIIICMALSVVAACKKGEAPIVEVIETPVDNVETKEAVRFSTNVSTSAAKVGTKSMAGIDEWNGKQDLHVFGFRKVATGLLDYTAASQKFINNVTASSPASGDYDTINVIDPDSGDANEPFYYSATNTYNFYAYYADDAAGEVDAVEIKSDSVNVKFTIDGSQDLMLAKAEAGRDIEKALNSPSLTDTDKAKIQRDLVAHEEYLYSAYSARRKVHPVLKFEHQLARFNFKIKVMNEEAEKITIKEIKLDSYSKGKLCVADELGNTGGIVSKTGKTEFALKDTTRTEGGVLETIEFVSKKLSDLLGEKGVTTLAEAEDSTVAIGCGIMVTPFEKHKLSLKYSQDAATAVGVVTAEYEIKPENVKTDEGLGVDKFEKGKQYTITICIYGLSEVKIYAELTPWVNTGEIVVDPDDPSIWADNSNN